MGSSRRCRAGRARSRSTIPRTPVHRTRSDPAVSGARNSPDVPNGSSTSATSASSAKPPGDRDLCRTPTRPRRGVLDPGRRSRREHDPCGSRAWPDRARCLPRPVHPVDDRAVRVVVERQHVLARRPTRSGMLGGGDMRPGMDGPVRQDRVPALPDRGGALADLVQPRRHARAAGASDTPRRTGPRRRGREGRAACPGSRSRRARPPRGRVARARRRRAAARRSGTMPNWSATAQPVWVVMAWSRPARPGQRRDLGRQAPRRASATLASPSSRAASARSRALWAKKALARKSESAFASHGRSAGASGSSQSPNCIAAGSRPSGAAPGRERADPAPHAVELAAEDLEVAVGLVAPPTARSWRRPPSPPARSAARPSSTTSGTTVGTPSIVVLLERQVAQPARPERLGVEQRAGRRGERLGVPGPAEPLVALGAVGRAPRRSCRAATRRRSRGAGSGRRRSDANVPACAACRC